MTFETLDDVQKAFDTITDPKAIFGDDVNKTLRQILKICQPDHVGVQYDHDPAKVAQAERLFIAAGRLAELATGSKDKPPVIIKSPKRSYEIIRLLHTGDVSDIHLAVSEGKNYLAKVSRIPDGAGRLKTESTIIMHLLKEAYTKHPKSRINELFPLLVETFPAADRSMRKQISIFEQVDGLYTLKEVKEKHKDGLDGRHIAWIMKRLLMATSFAHDNNYIHGAVVPTHILIDPQNHSIKLIGWGQSVIANNPLTAISTAYKDFYPQEVFAKKPASPSTDIYMIAKCMVDLAGGSHKLPRKFQLFLKFCTLDGQLMRPQNAMVLYQELTEVLQAVYGTPKFVTLTM